MLRKELLQRLLRVIGPIRVLRFGGVMTAPMGGVIECRIWIIGIR